MAEGALTIDELAQRVGMTSRNIRAHQTRGLLPPPSLSGRTGQYGPEHVERLELIKRLQDQGLNLQAIALVIAGGEPELDRVRAALLAPWKTEDPYEAPVQEVARRLGEEVVDAEVVQRATTLRIVGPSPSGDASMVHVLLPAIIRAGEAMTRLGVPLRAQVEVVEEADDHVRAVADAFIDLAREHLVAELAHASVSERSEALQPDALQAAVEQLRTVAAEVLITLFHRAMTDASEQLVGDLLEAGDGVGTSPES